MNHGTLCARAASVATVLALGCSSAAQPPSPDDASRPPDVADVAASDLPPGDTPAEAATPDASPTDLGRDATVEDARSDALTSTDTSDASTDTPTDIPIDTSTDTSIDIPTDIPIDTSTDTSTDIPTDIPADTSADVALDVLTCLAGTADCNGDPSDGCEASFDSIAHCGRCGLRCLTLAPHAVSACEARACAVRCAEGYVRTADRCELAPVMIPPRPIAPLSHRISSSRIPTFEWVNRHGEELATIDLCDEPGCPMASTRSVMVTGSRYTPPTPLTTPVVWWRVRGRFSDGRVTTHGPVWQLFVENRTTASRPWGVRLDVDRDGNPDFIASTAETTSTPGVLHVVTRAGAPTGVLTGAAIPAPSGAMGFGGRYTGSLLQAPTAVADVNGDGYIDLLATAPGSGQVYVFHGTSAGLPSASSATLAHLPSSDMRVAGAGDVNHDGYADALVSDSAGAYLYAGSADGLRGPTQSFPRMAVAGGGGDINDDGFDDAFLTLPRSDDVALQLCPSLAGTALSCVRTIRGTSAAGRVEILGMYDADNTVDFAASGDDLRVYSGSIVPTLTETLSNGHRAYAVGDSDGDGDDDFALAASFNRITVYRRSVASEVTTFGAPCCMPGDQIDGPLAGSIRRRDGYSELYVAMQRTNRYVIAVYRWPMLGPYPTYSITPTTVAGQFDPLPASALSRYGAAWTVTAGN